MFFSILVLYIFLGDYVLVFLVIIDGANGGHPH